VWLRWLLVLGTFAAAAILYPHLPDQIPTHWNFAGQPNQYSPKTYGAWILPGVMLLMVVLFPLLRRFDPKAENYAAFAHAWDVFQTAFVAFMAYIFVITMVATFDPSQSAMVGRYVVFGIGALFVIIGNYMGKIRQNWFIGLRTPWTLADPETWSKSQRFAGWMFVLCGLVAMAESLIWWHAAWVFFWAVALAVILPIVHSYLIFKGKKTATSLIAFALLALVILIVGLRLVAGEDDWICRDGTWVTHGNPSVPQPETPCP